MENDSKEQNGEIDKVHSLKNNSEINPNPGISDPHISRVSSSKIFGTINMNADSCSDSANRNISISSKKEINYIDIKNYNEGSGNLIPNDNYSPLLNRNCDNINENNSINNNRKNVTTNYKDNSDNNIGDYKGENENKNADYSHNYSNNNIYIDSNNYIYVENPPSENKDSKFCSCTCNIF